jgi:hypothetical protein
MTSDRDRLADALGLLEDEVEQAGPNVALRVAFERVRLIATNVTTALALDVGRLLEAARRSGMPREVMVADIEDLAAEYVALATEHRPGDPHEYDIRCTVCGEPGVVRLTIDPQFDGAVPHPDPASFVPETPLPEERT